MVLIDTSVWVAHFRSGQPHIKKLLLKKWVYCHPLVVGELSLGNLNNRDEILLRLMKLPIAAEAGDREILYFIEQHKLFGKGIGLVDVHLLASACLSKAKLWTIDKNMSQVAQKLGILYT